MTVAEIIVETSPCGDVGGWAQVDADASVYVRWGAMLLIQC